VAEDGDRLYTTKHKRIVSGYTFPMTTNDTANKPLPGHELLELQWHLQRVLSMAGAADWLGKDFDHDLDDRVDPLPAFDENSETVDPEVYVSEWLAGLQDGSGNGL
jgi:hypothetical protein